jgi:fluoroquinolone resistance protein
MVNVNFENQLLEGVNFSEQPPAKGEYDQCTFRNCNFSGVDLSEFVFIDSVFELCDLSMVKLKNCSFCNVKFKACKQLGSRFDDCHKMLLSFTFDGCTLNYSSFYKLKLKGISFRDCPATGG